MGDGFFGAKTAFMPFLCVYSWSMFCADFNPYFSRYAFHFKTLMISLLWPFPTVAFYAYFPSSFTAYLSFNFPWYFPEKSGNICLFSVMFHLIFSGFYLFNLFSWAVFFELSNLFVYLFVVSLPYLLSCLAFLFIIYFVFSVFVKLC